MITQALLDRLLSEKWLPKSFEGQLYLAKLDVSASDSTALTFLITDTKSVWAEALTSNRIARRFRELNRDRPPEHPSTDQAEPSLQIIQRIHSLRHFANTSFTVTDSMYANDGWPGFWPIGGRQILLVFKAIHYLGSCQSLCCPVTIQANMRIPWDALDKSFTFELEDYTWSWEADSLGAATAAAVLSQHLFLPLAATAGLAFQGPQYVSELSESELGSKIDTAAQDYRRLPALKFSQLFRKPIFATSLQRVTAVLNHVEELPPILFDVGSQLASQLSNPDYRSNAPSHEPQPPVPPPRREPSFPAATTHSTREPPRPLRAPTPPAVVPQRVPSQKMPSPSPTSVPMDVDMNLEGDVTEADTNSDPGSPAQKQSKVQQKTAIPSSKSSLPPAAKKRKVQEVDTGASEEEEDSDGVKLKPTSKGKTKGVVQDSDSDDDLSAGRGRGRGAAVSRVKQPLKRGGRRL